jgi:hypothetical protein
MIAGRGSPGYGGATAETQREPVPRDDSGELSHPDARFVIPVDGNHHTLRWVMAHMTSETARHAGHADIIREQIDGTTGR